MVDAQTLLGKSAPEALEVTEAAREATWQYPSFVAELFMGRVRTDLVFPFPEQDESDRRIGDEFIARLEPPVAVDTSPRFFNLSSVSTTVSSS